MEMKKKIWERPQLVIIAKGRPEENVLLHCKAIGMTGTLGYAQETGQNACDELKEQNCGDCQSRGGKGS